tara:strand:+ start:1954 stop:2349 length:396 start_codon:yes stop_codon:yes gene_type:complete
MTSKKFGNKNKEVTIMAMTPEAKVKSKVVKHLKNMGAYYFFPATGGYGKSGVPDIVGCYDGLFFGIECKAGNNKATALQLKNLSEITQAGGIASIINEDNVHTVPDILVNKELISSSGGWEQLEFDFEDMQ